MEYIDAAMVGRLGAAATASIGIVSSSTWLLHGIIVGLYTAFSIQIAQTLAPGASRTRAMCCGRRCCSTWRWAC